MLRKSRWLQTSSIPLSPPMSTFNSALFESTRGVIANQSVLRSPEIRGKHRGHRKAKCYRVYAFSQQDTLATGPSGRKVPGSGQRDLRDGRHGIQVSHMRGKHPPSSGHERLGSSFQLKIPAVEMFISITLWGFFGS